MIGTMLIDLVGELMRVLEKLMQGLDTGGFGDSGGRRFLESGVGDNKEAAVVTGRLSLVPPMTEDGEGLELVSRRMDNGPKKIKTRAMMVNATRAPRTR